MYNKLTPEALKKLEDELEHRKTVTRWEINEELKEARAHGDLSENFEYKAAKKRRFENNRRMGYLDRMIKTAKLISVEDVPEDCFNVGQKAIVRFLDDDSTEEIELVTTVEIDPLNNKFSIESPFGRKLYRQKVGTVAEIESPTGNYKVILDKIIK